MTVVASDSTPLLPPAVKEVNLKCNSHSRSARTHLLKTLSDSTRRAAPSPRVARPRKAQASRCILLSCLAIPCALAGGAVVLRVTFSLYGDGAAIAVLSTLTVIYLGVACVVLRVVRRRGERVAMDLESRRGSVGSSDCSECSGSTFVGDDDASSTKIRAEPLDERTLLDRAHEGIPALPALPLSDALPPTTTPDKASARNLEMAQHRRQLGLLTLARAAHLSSLSQDAVYAAPVAPSLSNEPALLAARTSYLAHAQEFGQRVHTSNARTPSAPSDAPLDAFALDGRLETLGTPAWLVPSASVSPSSSVSLSRPRSPIWLPSWRPHHSHSVASAAGDAHAHSEIPDGEDRLDLREEELEEERPRIGERGRSQEHAMLVFAQFRNALDRLEQGQRKVVEHVVGDL